MKRRGGRLRPRLPEGVMGCPRDCVGSTTGVPLKSKGGFVQAYNAQAAACPQANGRHILAPHCAVETLRSRSGPDLLPLSLGVGATNLRRPRRSGAETKFSSGGLNKEPTDGRASCAKQHPPVGLWDRSGEEPDPLGLGCIGRGRCPSGGRACVPCEEYSGAYR